MECPKCKNLCTSNTTYCPICGYRVRIFTDSESVESPTAEAPSQTIFLGKFKISTEVMKKISRNIYVTLGIVVLFLFWQLAAASSAKAAFNSDDYEKADKIANSVFIGAFLGEYKEKIEIMDDVYYDYNRWKNYEQYSRKKSQDPINIKLAQGAAKDTLMTCVSFSELANNNGCIQKVDAVSKEVAQWLTKQGIDVEEYLLDQQKKGHLEFYPLLDEEKITNEIYRIADMIGGKSAQEYLQEKELEKNPLKISQTQIDFDDGYYYVRGTVNNVSKTTHYYVKVKVTYYDKNGTVLTTDWTYAVDSSGIRGGENQQFDLMTKITGIVKSYKVEILEYD